jgi:uncharacterized protein
MDRMRQLGWKWQLIAALCVAALAGPFVATLAVTGAESAAAAKEQKPAPRPSHRLALQINTDDPTTMRSVISTSLHLTKYFEAKNEALSIEIVAYSAGIHMFRADTSPVQGLLQVLRSANPNIRFVICEATRLGMQRSEGRELSFIDSTQSVPNGPARLIELQESGWSYIRS